MHDQGGLTEQLTAAFKAGVCVGQMGSGGGLGMGMDIGGSNPSDGPHTKAEVNYRACDNGEECCGNCVHYGKHNCEIVSGNIQPQMVCDEFVSKTDTKPKYPDGGAEPTDSPDPGGQPSAY